MSDAPRGTANENRHVAGMTVLLAIEAAEKRKLATPEELVKMCDSALSGYWYPRNIEKAISRIKLRAKTRLAEQALIAAKKAEEEEDDRPF